jgi:integrase/recombinase XerD
MASIFKQQYTVKDKDGNRVKKKSKFWYIDYKFVDGIRKRVKAFKDKTATTQMAAKLEKEAELAEVGIVDRFKEHRKRPLKEHLADFKANILSKGNTVQHAKLTSNRISAIVADCKFNFMSDISASKVIKCLADRRKNGLSIKSSNDYLQSIKQFSRWLVADRRMSDNPLAYLSGLNVKTDRRHDRRAMTIEEFGRLVEKTSKGKKHSKMTGPERVKLYLLAANTGLRASELASLT